MAANRGGAKFNRSKFIQTVATISILALIGYLGHHTGWSLSFEHDKPHAKKTHAETVSHSTKSENPLCVEYKSDQAIKKSGITTVPAESKELSEYVIANGLVGYNKRLVARLAPRVSGTIWKIEKHLGDSVNAGDVLVVIEASDVGKMKAEFLSELIATESNEENLKKLELTQSAVPERQIRQARAELRASRVRLLNAEQSLVNLGINVRMEDYQGLPETKQAAMIHYAGLPNQYSETLDPDTTTSNLVAIFSPFDGVVTHGDVGLGEVVEPAKRLIQIADVRSMWITLQVPKEDVPKLRIGQPIYFRVDGVLEELTSKISWISTEVDEETRTLQVRAEVENPVVHPDEPTVTGQRLLRANTFGSGRILVRTNSTAIVVPTECIQSDGIHDMIFVKTGDTTFEGRIIHRGTDNGDYTEIDGPVAVGEQIVQHGSHILKSQVLLSQAESLSP